MGRQVRIRATNPDLCLLQSTIERLGQVVFLKDEWKTQSPESVSDLMVKRMGHESLTVYACRACDLDAIKADFVSAQGYWSIDATVSPVVEVGQTYYDGRVCRGGRLWYETGYYDTAGRWVDKPGDFLRWADSVLRATRRAFHRDKELDAYLGPDARELRRQGKVEFPLNW